MAESLKHALEEAPWVALRMMEERKNLLANLASHSGPQWNARQDERLAAPKAHVNRLREFLLHGSDEAQTAQMPQ